MIFFFHNFSFLTQRKEILRLLKQIHPPMNRLEIYTIKYSYSKKNSIYIVVFIFILILLDYNISQAQAFNNILKPSPEVAAFKKYGDVPVSTYTGVPDIQIPIWNITEGDINVPISISYHAGGNTVQEEASRVGLGWVLQAGGMISRTIRGIDDLTPVYGYLNHSIPEVFSYQATHAFQIRQPNNSIQFCERTVGGQTIDLSSAIPPAQENPDLMLDLEPDDFQYNFLGHIGSFTVNKNLSIVSESKNNLKIELLVSDSTWLITTTDGMRYYFKSREINNFFSSFHQNTTSWFLTKIVSPSGDIVNFHYSRADQYAAIGLPVYSEQIKLHSAPSEPSVQPVCSPGIGAITYDMTPGRFYRNVFLDSISYTYGSVHFEYANRNDLQYEKRLKSIIIKKKGYSSNNEFFLLKQDYFQTTHTGGLNYPANPEARKYYDLRLKLNALVRTTADSLKETYTFLYNSTQLPSKCSYAIDHWGFYNGRHNNNSYLPIWGVQIPSQASIFYAGSADREPDNNAAQACILKEIIYPTGGSTKFEYELNDFDMGNSINSLNTVTGTVAPEFKSHTSTFLTRRYSGTTNNETFALEIKPHVGPVTFTVRSQMGSIQSGTSVQPEDMFIEIYTAGVSNYLYRYNLATPIAWTSSDANYNYELIQYLTLPPGNYQIKTQFKSNVLFLNYITINFLQSADINIPSNHSIRLGAGLRIKTITTVTGETNTSIVRKYLYRYKKDTNNDGIDEEFSFGRRLFDLDYTNKVYTPVCYTYPISTDHTTTHTSTGGCTSIHLYSNNAISSRGSVIGYDQVTELLGETGNNGKSEYYYNNNPSLCLSYDGVSWSNEISGVRPWGAANLINLTNGILKEQRDFKMMSNGQFKIVRKAKKIYESIPIETKVGIKRVSKVYTNALLDVCTFGEDCTWLLSQYPAFQSGLSRLSSESETLYSENLDSLSASITYAYEPGNLKHYNPIKITRTTSDNNQTESSITLYSSDYAPGVQFIDSLTQAHILIPIETVNYLENQNGGTIISGHVKTYYPSKKAQLHKELKLNSDHNTALSTFKFSNKPIGINPTLGVNETFSRDSRYEDMYSYNFDNNSNVIEILSTKGPVRSYVWDYNNQFVVAEVTNANVNQIYYQGFESLVSSQINSIDSKTGKKSWNGTFTIPIASRPVSGTYIVEYWEKLTTTWNKKISTIINTIPTSIISSGSIDDIRIYPVNATIKSFSYEPLSGIKSSLDENGEVRYFEYDAFGRLKVIRNSNRDILKVFDVRYKQ